MARLTRDEMRGKAQTVLGLIDPAELGSTLMHEHLLWNITPPDRRSEPLGPPLEPGRWWDLVTGMAGSLRNTTQHDHALATRAVAEMVAQGGRTVVELTIGGLEPDPEGLAKVARETGAHIVMGCGHYVHDYQDPANAGRSVDSFAQEMIAQVQEGAWGTGVRAGIVGEIGCQWPWTELEQRVLAGAVVAQQETGGALTIHPARHQDHPGMLVEFLRAHGADLGRTIIDHIDRTIFDDERLFRLADAGVVLEWDLFGQEATYYAHADIDMPNDGARIRAIRRVMDRGHGDQVVVSHDICHVIQFSEFGGHGYGHIHRTVLPHMRKRGFEPAEIDRFMVANPRRLLTFV
ncbi:MAG: phosphotriesterase family protein [Janthinobacterium lividum]